MIETRAIGHMSEPIEIYLQEKKLENKKKNVIDIYFREKRVANHYLWEKWRQALGIKINDDLSRMFLEPVFRYIVKKRDKKMLVPFRHASDIWYHNIDNEYNDRNVIKKKEFDYEWQQYDTKNLLETSSPTIKFSTVEKDFAYKKLKKKNISKNDNIILLIVRDPAYSNFLYPDRASSELSNRDNDIDDFIGLVQYLCEKNYKVIRMGRVMSNELKYKHNNFFDYAFSDFKDDFFDIFLFNISKFVISTGSGLDAVASLFRKKILYLNYGEMSALNYQLNFNISFIYPKKIIDSEKNKELGIFDLFKYGINRFNNIEHYKKKNIILKTLSANQMINATIEMEEYLKNKYSDSSLEANREINNLLQEAYGFENKFYWSRDYLDLEINKNINY